MRGPSSQPPSYAVLWRETDGLICSGELELADDCLQLEGLCGGTGMVRRDIAYRTIAAVRIGRSERERIDGRTALVLELPRQQTLRITSPVGLGMIHEMADRLDLLVSEGLRR